MQQLLILLVVTVTLAGVIYVTWDVYQQVGQAIEQHQRQLDRVIKPQ